MSDIFAPAIAACLRYAGGPAQGEIEDLVRQVLESPPALNRDDLTKLQRRIEALLPDGHDRIALVYGGATKIKGYVFEAPKLPEIRGASALLDWVNEVELPRIWGIDVTGLPEDKISQKLVEGGIIYASGGNILAFAPAAKGQDHATAIEHTYTQNTLTANSVAVSVTCSLLAVRYGRLRHKQGTEELYWAENFLSDWEDPPKRQALEKYYYPPLEPLFTTLEAQLAVLQTFFKRDPKDDTPLTKEDEEHIQIAARFFNRKTFGELVTVAATQANRRRDERATYGEARSMPLYSLPPSAEKCDSSGIRPAVVRTTVGDEIAPREMSEASARKRYVGQLVKVRDDERAKATKWFTDHFDSWSNPQGLAERSWEQQWREHIGNTDNANSHYASAISREQIVLSSIRPAQDVGEIGQASSPSRYIGVIYADGNNVGRLIATLTTPQEYYETSLILRDAAKGAVFTALAQHLEPAHVRSDRGDWRWVHPFEILAIGGDDLFLIVPGDQALDVALAIGQYFESELAKKLPAPTKALLSNEVKGRYGADTCIVTDPYKPSIGLSAGVIVAQENAPIFFLRDLVEELLKIAKDKAKVNAKQSFFGGAVDFMVMKSITMVTNKIPNFRKAALGDESARRLTARPYTWHEFAGLLKTVRALKKARVPRSQLYRLRQVLDADQGGGVVASVMEYLYTRARLRGDVPRVLMEHIEHNWCHAPIFIGGRMGMPPWLPLGDRGNSWETFWPDLLEAYEMVPEGDEQ